MQSIAYAIVVLSGAMLTAAAQLAPPNPDGPRCAAIIGVITLVFGFGLLLRDKREEP